MEWQQLRELLKTPVLKTLDFDNFLLFEYDDECETSSILVLRCSTCEKPVETNIILDNISRQIIAEDQSVYLIHCKSNNSKEFPKLVDYIKELGGESALIGRVDNQGILWGFLVGYSFNHRVFSEQEIKIFTFLASCIAMCVETTRLKKETTLRFSEATSLEMVSSALVEKRSLDAILEVIIDKAVQLLNAEDALVLLLESGKEMFQVRARIGDNVAGLTRGRMSVENSLNGLVVKTGNPLVSHDAQTDDRADQERAIRLNVRTVVIAPLTIRNRTIGTIAVHNKRTGIFNKTDLEVLCSFANQAAVAIENAQLYSDLLNARDEVSKKALELQELLIRTLHIQEDERKRIASDIHDSVISQIVGALYEVESCISQNHRKQNLEPKLQLIKQILNESVEITRSSIYNLWPSTLEHIGLDSALRELLMQFSERSGIRHSFEINGRRFKLNSEVQIAIYRIIQEALNNVFHHSSASYVDITIRYSTKQVSIEVRDNGIGFNTHQVMQSNSTHGFGLISMRERALSVGGTLLVKSELDNGCQIILKIPIENNIPMKEK